MNVAYTRCLQTLLQSYIGKRFQKRGNSNGGTADGAYL